MGPEGSLLARRAPCHPLYSESCHSSKARRYERHSSQPSDVQLQVDAASASTYSFCGTNFGGASLDTAGRDWRLLRDPGGGGAAVGAPKKPKDNAAGSEPEP